MPFRTKALPGFATLVTIAVSTMLAGCGGAATPTSAASTASATAASSAQRGGSGSPEAVFTPIPDASQAPDTGSGAAHGDIPDNAVFLTYQSAAWRFSIQYVEGWQVRTVSDGVTIRDKDSSESVRVVTAPPDIAAYVNGTDLPALRSQPGFSLVKRDTVKVGSAVYQHIAYHAPADPDPVTGKQVASTIDRFYVPGPGLAIVTLSTPDGVDNVDAFRQMITSLKWS